MLLLAAAAAASACNAPAPSPSASENVQRGGTLHVVIPTFRPTPGYTPPDQTTLDFTLPNAFVDSGELLRCCLGRTLMSYNGQPTNHGGAELLPDLTTGAPEISADGLSWTFHLRRGIRYAPPLQATEVTAADFVRALKRFLSRGPDASVVFEDIKGVAAYAGGHAGSISGLETPDRYTLVVRLNTPEGDLAYRLSFSDLSPIPPSPADPSAPFGVLTGHDAGISGFIVSTGPYMIDGAGSVDYRLPPAQQAPASGLVAGRSLTFVRNPSWSPSTDSLRIAYADRIVIDYGGDIDAAVAALDAGREDVIISVSPPPQVPLSAVHDYESNPRKGRVDIESRDSIRYISMNLARPPFDDIHVRRAVAFALDRDAIEQAFGGASSGAVTSHLAFDSMEDNALINYNPYRTANAAARLQAAKQEMAQSKYDSTHGGSCDAAVCAHISAVALTSRVLPPQMIPLVKQDLVQIGLHLDVTPLGGDDAFKTAGDPTKDPGMFLFWAWLKDYPNGADYFVPLFSNESIDTGNNFSLMGATADQLHGWGYEVTAVPNVDDRIDACLPLVGQAQQRCWTGLDQYMMEKVVSTLPFVSESYVELVPARLRAYSYDQSNDLPSLDRIAPPL